MTKTSQPITDWEVLHLAEFKKSYFKELKNFLTQEIKASKTIYPHPNNFFEAFKLCPLNNTKVVILGQDPYHGPNQAHGLSFSVQKGIKTPPSLQNIYKELKSDLSLDIPQHGNLKAWAQQGVLLLNSTLSVQAKSPASHAGKGLIDNNKHLILQAAHPSPFSAHNGFFGCQHFSKTNQYLTQHNSSPIDWQIK